MENKKCVPFVLLPYICRCKQYEYCKRFRVDVTMFCLKFARIGIAVNNVKPFGSTCKLSDIFDRIQPRSEFHEKKNQYGRGQYQISRLSIWWKLKSYTQTDR
jgi:hypothetical protein